MIQITKVFIIDEIKFSPSHGQYLVQVMTHDTLTFNFLQDQFFKSKFSLVYIMKEYIDVQVN